MKLNDCYTLDPIRISPEDLYLDPRNPRIALEFQGSWSIEDILNPNIQERLLETLQHNYHIEKLMQSIREMGFQEGMGSFLVKEVSPDKYIVLEGNRRTAAIKLLLKDPEMRESFSSIPVSKFQYTDNETYTEDEVISCYLARIHIDGPEEWGAMEKAKFVYDDYMRAFQTAYPLHHPWEENFQYDPQCGARAASISNLKAPTLIKVLKVYRVYVQLISSGYAVKADIYSLLDLAVGSKAEVRNYFEVDECFQMTDVALDRFTGLCVGGTRPIKNPKIFSKFSKILREGTEFEIKEAELGGIEQMHERLLARLERRGPKPQLERIVKIFEQVGVEDVRNDSDNRSLTRNEKELLKQIILSANNMLNILG